MKNRYNVDILDYIVTSKLGKIINSRNCVLNSLFTN